MTAHVSTRQPFASLDGERLQSLSNVKNRQNAIPTSFSSPLKPTQSTSTKRRYSPSSYDEYDSENIDPAIFNSPTKRSKTADGLAKPSAFLCTTSASTKSSPSMFSSDRTVTTPSSMPSVRKALSSPSTTNSTPISLSRGSPKHKRVGLLSKRRTSSSPFRRVDPPAFTRNSSPALPFSIDAALSGTISTYKPKAAPVVPDAVPTLEEAMPRSWFFDIHEDTPEEEATNLMEHSACVLDISSDDDCETKRKNDEMERGKENIPPPDFFFTSPTSASANPRLPEMDNVTQHAALETVKLPKLRCPLAQDAMDQDRSPLSDLPAADFFGPGLDASSHVIVDALVEKRSSLSKEFEFAIPALPKKEAVVGEKPSEMEKEIEIYTDETAGAEALVTVQEEARVLSDVVAESSELITPTMATEFEDGSMIL